MGLFKFFNNDRHDNENANDVAHQILNFTKSIVVREDLAESLREKLKKEPQYKSAAPVIRLIQEYFLFEDFITHNKPLVIIRPYTKESLREEIRTKFSINELPNELKLIFLPKKEQLFQTYLAYTSEMSQYIINQVGSAQLQSIYNQVTSQSPFAGIDITAKDVQVQVIKRFSQVDEEELTELFTKVNAVIYQHIAVSFGESTAMDITQKCYARFKEIYDYDLITSYLKVIPPGVLDKERVAFMTRSDLENEAMAVAVEKIRSKQLEEEKEIIEKKVEEQTAVIRKEKEALKQAVLHSQENEAKLLASVRGLTIGFILTDTSNSIITLNYAARRILRILEEVETVGDLEKHFAGTIEIAKTIEECRTKKQPQEFKEIDLNGSIIHVTITPAFLSNTDREYVGSVVLIEDITEKKRLERTKDEFFAIASHELRTPLTAIRGSVSILKSYYSDKISEGDIPQLISYIDTSADRLINIVNEFLSVSRLEQGRIIFLKETFSIAEIIENVVREMHFLAENKSIALKFENRTVDNPLVIADKDKCKQILINLIGNAVKFTDKGNITISLQKLENFVVISVADTGTGISPENQRLLFRKFQQADNDIFSHDASKGTGLGLYISKKLIENMGGTINLDRSEIGQGSTFSFTLPLAGNK